jgi:hypothetical protein
MKRVLAILFMILAAAALLPSVASSGESDSTGILGPEGSAFFLPGPDTKKVENKMTEALASLDSWKKARAEEKSEPLAIKPKEALSEGLPGSLALNNKAAVDYTINYSNSSNTTLDNISVNNTSVNDTLINNNSINSLLDNSSALNSSAAQVAGANDDRLKSNEAMPKAPAKFNANTNSSAGPQNVGSSSKGNFKGFYGMTASRHEMGKSGIDSSMFLSGTFEMEKSVKFQDRGVD